MPLEIINQAIIKGRTILPRKRGVQYQGFCDPSEGTRKGADSMTFGISHTEEKNGVKTYILDVLLEFQPPFHPNEVIRTIAGYCKQYGIVTIQQDRHSIGWVSKDLEEHSIEVKICEKPKSQLYEYFSVLMNKNQVELPDNKRLKNQILGLQRFQRSGGTKIDHYKGGHDDIINTAAGAIVMAMEEGSGPGIKIWRL